MRSKADGMASII